MGDDSFCSAKGFMVSNAFSDFMNSRNQAQSIVYNQNIYNGKGR